MNIHEYACMLSKFMLLEGLEPSLFGPRNQYFPLSYRSGGVNKHLLRQEMAEVGS